MEEPMSTRHKSMRCFRAVAILAALAMGLVPMSSPVSAAAHSGIISPEVVHTGTAPTGYEVTFRYYDPTATRVRLRGEWYFSDAAHTTLHSSAGWLPWQW